MITVKLMGGLGNQMFQMAFGLALRHRGYQVQFDNLALRERTHREYSLGYFGELPLGRSEDSFGLIITEVGAGFNPKYFAPPTTCTMIGYWQSEKYFSSIANKVREAFRFQEPRAVTFGMNIAVHVRRQDYVGLQHFHGMPDISYYRQAVALIRKRTGLLLNVLVFSDDRQWCRENLPPDFTIVEGKDKYEDLKLMAACDFHVVANSSFSWWGAWLSRQRLVVAPEKWFADASMDSKDIVPKRWIKI